MKIYRKAEMESNITLDQIREIIRSEVQLASKEFFTADEASAFLGIQKSYLYQLTHDNVIAFSKPWGKKLYFSRQDLVKFALSNRSASYDEIESRAATILATSKKR